MGQCHKVIDSVHSAEILGGINFPFYALCHPNDPQYYNSNSGTDVMIKLNVHCWEAFRSVAFLYSV